mgnify:FL=1
MNTITILWLIFTLLFFGLAIFHFLQARKKIPQFQQSKRPGAGMGSVKILGMDIDQLTTDLANGFNTHIDELNQSNKLINIIQGVGYSLAALTAVFSMYLTIVDKWFYF